MGQEIMYKAGELLNQEEIVRIEKEKMLRLRTELIELSPYKVGDKVVVKNRNVEREVFVLDVKVSTFRTNWVDATNPEMYYEYIFAAVKKDGTMSKNSAGLWGATIIRKVE
jgi:hypothetical protein